MSHRRDAASTSRRWEEPLSDCAEFWSRRAGRPLSSEDGREITKNLSGFFGLLSRWRDADEAAGARTTTTSARSDE